MNKVKLLDCKLRDGGYYNSWDFDKSIIEKYLVAMKEISVDYVELGLRSFNKEGFKGACAYSTDNFIKNLKIPKNLNIGVMVNASELLQYPEGIEEALSKLFVHSDDSPVSLVRIACHIPEFEKVLEASNWLKDRGYIVGYNLMQIANCSRNEVRRLASIAKDYPLDVLYFADSLGSLTPEETVDIIEALRSEWEGEVGIHTHDNMGYALANSKSAADNGVTWIDGTVTGMGRGPGNAKTEYLAIELDALRSKPLNILPLMNLINEYFKGMQQICGWGTNTYYYLAGKYGIHPTYIQEMISDSSYNEEDILAVISHLKMEDSKKFSIGTLEAARNFYSGQPKGNWKPKEVIDGREVVILGTGPSVFKHKQAIENYIEREKPFVIALNTQSSISSELIDIRAACHPVRLLADSNIHEKLPQPLVIPAAMLSESIVEAFGTKEILDYGISVEQDTFKFGSTHSVIPNSLVLSYVLSIAASGNSSRILLAGFDGYGAEDARTKEINKTLTQFTETENTPQLVAVTPTVYKVSSSSIYAY